MADHSTVWVNIFLEGIATFSEAICSTWSHSMVVWRAQNLIWLALMWMGNTWSRESITLCLVSPHQVLLHIDISLVVTESVHEGDVESWVDHVEVRSRIHLKKLIGIFEILVLPNRFRQLLYPNDPGRHQIDHRFQVEYHQQFDNRNGLLPISRLDHIWLCFRIWIVQWWELHFLGWIPWWFCHRT